MVQRSLRSRSLRRVSRKVPGGRTVRHFRLKKAASASCGQCGASLKGVPKAIPSKARSFSKSQTRPSRPHGGMLCSSCTRAKIIDSVRAAAASG